MTYVIYSISYLYNKTTQHINPTYPAQKHCEELRGILPSLTMRLSWAMVVSAMAHKHMPQFVKGCPNGVQRMEQLASSDENCVRHERQDIPN